MKQDQITSTNTYFQSHNIKTLPLQQAIWNSDISSCHCDCYLSSFVVWLTTFSLKLNQSTTGVRNDRRVGQNLHLLTTKLLSGDVSAFLLTTCQGRGGPKKRALQPLQQLKIPLHRNQPRPRIPMLRRSLHRRTRRRRMVKISSKNWSHWNARTPL